MARHRPRRTRRDSRAGGVRPTNAGYIAVLACVVAILIVVIFGFVPL
jgi:hypothetical protein